jgi:enoyl-[acyl-carrier-protein] reductase (NADH)
MRPINDQNRYATRQSSPLAESKMPSGRLEIARDVAATVLYLASDLVDLISSDVINVDGGVIPAS